MVRPSQKAYRFVTKTETNFHEIIRLGVAVCNYPGKLNFHGLAKIKKSIKDNPDYFTIPEDAYNDV